MMEPLSLKSEPGSISEQRRGNLLTAAQLMIKFSLKSPSSRICLTDRDAPSARSISTPRVQRQEVNLFKKAKEGAGGGATVEQSANTGRKKQKGENIARASSSCREKLLKLVSQSKNKEKNGKILSLPLHKVGRGKQNKCQTQRSTPTAHRATSKFNICLDSKASIPPLTAKNTKQEQFYRKSSDASTLSLRTKHTASMQCIEEDNDLFHRQSSLQLETDQRGSENMLKALQFAKKKLYQQIYSLDRRLMNDYQEEQTEPAVVPKKKQTILISLRKKEEAAHLSSSSGPIA